MVATQRHQMRAPGSNWRNPRTLGCFEQVTGRTGLRATATAQLPRLRAFDPLPWSWLSFSFS